MIKVYTSAICYRNWTNVPALGGWTEGVYIKMAQPGSEGETIVTGLQWLQSTSSECRDSLVVSYLHHGVTYVLAQFCPCAADCGSWAGAGNGASHTASTGVPGRYRWPGGKAHGFATGYMLTPGVTVAH